MARICNALPADVFQAACVYSVDLFRKPLSEMSFTDVHNITNSCREYAYTVKGEILTGTEF